jgi:hypothetical protein
MSTPKKMTKAQLKAARHQAIVELAKQYESEGDLELDDDERVKVSEGDDNGAYVQMWKWVDFADTRLCKDHGDSKEYCGYPACPGQQGLN